MGVNNLPRVVTRQCAGRELNLQPLDYKSNTLPLHYRATQVHLHKSISFIYWINVNKHELLSMSEMQWYYRVWNACEQSASAARWCTVSQHPCPWCAVDRDNAEEGCVEAGEAWYGSQELQEQLNQRKHSVMQFVFMIHHYPSFIGSMRSPWMSLNFEKKFQILESPWKQSRSLKVLEFERSIFWNFCILKFNT